MGKIKLLVDGTEFENWTQATCTASIEELARTFSFTTKRSISNGAFRGKVFDIKPQSECKVYIDNILFLTGYIDRVASRTSATETSINFEGRSKTSDIIDCTVDAIGANFKNRNIKEIAGIIASKFNVNVVCDLDLPKFKYTAYNQGEKCIDYLKRLADLNGVTLTTNERGDIVITKAGTEKYNTSFKENMSFITEWGFDENYAGRYSEYTIKGQTDEKNITSSFKDDTVKRYRPLVIVSETDEVNIKERATNHAMRSIGDGISGTLTIKNFTDAEGKIYLPNKQIYCGFPNDGIDQMMLIKSASYSCDAQSTSCVLELADPRAFYEKRNPINKSKSEIKGLPDAKK